MQPDAWSILANLLYWLMLIVLTLAKVISLASVSFGLIASAVCALLGPIFVPFFIVPKLDWLFWSWLKAFIQYSFIPVVSFAFLMIFERFVFNYLTTLPPGITEDLYLVYGLQSLVVIGTFVVGILLVPSLTSSIFSGQGGQSILRNFACAAEGGLPCVSSRLNAKWRAALAPIRKAFLIPLASLRHRPRSWCLWVLAVS